MVDEVFRENQKVILERENFQDLLDALDIKGYKICGPTIKDSAIVYDEISSVDELPIGWTDHQNGGYYRLMKAKKDDFVEINGPDNPLPSRLTGRLFLFYRYDTKCGLVFLNS